MKSFGPNPRPWVPLVTHTAVYFLALLALAAGAAIYLEHQQHTQRVARALAMERANMEVAAARIASSLEEVLSDLQIIQQAPVVQAYSLSPDPSTLPPVRRLFRLFVNNVGAYEQIRLLDTQGRELIRVDSQSAGARVAPDSALADHSERPYVKVGNALPSDSLYLSALEINHDRTGSGVMQPQLRLASPLFNAAGERVGLLVLDVLGHWLLHGFSRETLGDAEVRLMLASDRLFWGLHDDERLRFPSSAVARKVLSSRFPTAWSEIASRVDGVAGGAEEWLAFTSLQPSEILRQKLARDSMRTGIASQQAVVSNDEQWKLISEIPADLFQFQPMDALTRNIPLALALSLVMLLLALMLAWLRLSALRHAQATQHSEARLRAVLDNTTALAFLKDHAGRYLFMNRRMADLLGLQQENAAGRTDADLFPPEVVRTLQAHDRQVLSGGEPVEFEEVVPLPTGIRTYLSVKFPLRQTEQGYALCGVATDITERKRAEEKLRLAATVFDNTNDGIIVVTPDHKTVAVNPAFTAITGYSPDEVLGRTPRLLRSDRHNASFFRSIRRQLAEVGQWQGEILNRRKNGEVYPTWETISTVRNEHGEITHHVAIFSDITAIKEGEERLAYLAHHDSLTGLPNRLLFRASLDQALVEARREQRQVALMFLDLDRFKLINDTLGHPVGDELLKQVAEVLKHSVRAQDLVSRLGGDEFTIILKDIHQPDDAVWIAEKILLAMEGPLTIGKRQIATSTSIGISLFPADAQTGDDLAMAADAALYRAKERGKGTFEFYTAELTAIAAQQLQLETELRQAIKNEEFRLHYQPQFDLLSGRMTGTEALLRWQHPDRGLLYPDSFISTAENTGLIVQIGDWIIQEACRQARDWLGQGFDIGLMSVNVSPQQLLRDNIVNKVRKALAAAPASCPPLKLEIEVTESLLQEAEASSRVLRELSQLGINIAIDDFGTGYSSLSHLQQLPIDKIKIAGVFIQDIPHNDNDRAIAAAIVSLSHSMRIPVIAEGVETEAQLDFLRTVGCDLVQGYCLSHPLAPRELEARMREWQAQGASDVSRPPVP